MWPRKNLIVWVCLLIKLDWKYLPTYWAHLWVSNRPLHVIELCHLWPATQRSSVVSHSKDVKKSAVFSLNFPLFLLSSLSSSLLLFFLSSELVEYISEKIVRKQIVQNQRCLVKEKAKIKDPYISVLREAENSYSLRQIVPSEEPGFWERAVLWKTWNKGFSSPQELLRDWDSTLAKLLELISQSYLLKRATWG